MQGIACYQALAKTFVAMTSAEKHRIYYFMIFGTCALVVYVIANLLAFLTDSVAKDWKGQVFHRFSIY